MNIEKAITSSVEKLNENPDPPKDKAIISNISKNIEKSKGVVSKKEVNSRKLKKSFPSKKPGFLYMMEYVPPDKKQKKFFDRFPVILVLQFVGNKFVGVNLHLLPFKERVIMLFFIIKNTQKTKDGYAKVKLSTLISNKIIFKYILNSSDLFYMTGIRSKIRPIYAEDIVESVFLPVEKFVGMSKNKVHSYMRKKLR